MKFKPALIPTLFTISALIVLLGLGTWQLQRLQWKNMVVEQVEQKIALPAIDMPLRIDNPEQLKYRRVTATGEFLHDQEIHLFTGPRQHRGDSGYDILTPMRLSNGAFVLIDRGWVPTDKKEASARPESNPSGVVKIEGMLHMGEYPGNFTPENDLVKNLWFWIDMDAISKHTGHDFQDLYIRRLQAGDDKSLPLGGVAKIKHKNDHLQYAITWYALAIILLVIYVLYHRKK